MYPLSLHEVLRERAREEHMTQVRRSEQRNLDEVAARGRERAELGALR